MGYNHFWKRPIEIDMERFRSIVSDFKSLVPALETEDAKIAGPFGEGGPVIHDGKIAFNGPQRCRHRGKMVVPLSDWERRFCQGDCTHETFDFPRILDLDRQGLVWDSCKTNRKPYDLAVTAVLLVVKHHLGKDVALDSNGCDDKWLEARTLCQRILGYGMKVFTFECNHTKASRSTETE